MLSPVEARGSEETVPSQIASFDVAQDASLRVSGWARRLHHRKSRPPNGTDDHSGLAGADAKSAAKRAIVQEKPTMRIYGGLILHTPNLLRC